jgi:hypothetical protein
MVKYKLSDGENRYTIEIDQGCYVYQLIDKLLLKYSTKTSNGITLLVNGVPLDPNKKISEYNIKDGKRIIFSEKYNGGK